MSSPTGQRPAKWLLSLHGIFGTGRNWRTFARRVTEARPDWGVVLVDLREHGRSRGAPPPHTLDAAARDVEALARALVSGGTNVAAIAGHSMGGKTALCVRQISNESRPTWVLDASPSAQKNWLDDARGTASPMRVLEALEAVGARHPSREAFVSALGGHGVPEGVGTWLATNLDSEGGGVVLPMDLQALRSLLEDAIRRDLWDDLQRAQGGDVRFVIAGQSSVVSVEDRQRLQVLAAETSWVHVDVIERSGHWLHVDALSDVVLLFSDNLD